MTYEQVLIIALLSASILMFLWGKWRHDMVAAAVLLACTVAGLIQPDAAFTGFGHPAVVTVACVLVLSRALQNSGVVDILARKLLPQNAGFTMSLTALVGIGALLSGFMNNVGAMALLMPLGLQMAKRFELPAGKVLMPLAFGTILGGMTTLIGTPPNLIVSGFRSDLNGDGFGMFDFAPVGLPIAIAGVLAISLIGWRLVPKRKSQQAGDFETGAYQTEALVTSGSKAAGMRLGEIESALDAAGAQINGLIRNEVRITAPQFGRLILAGDILLIEAEADSLAQALSSLGLKLEEGQELKENASEDPEDGTHSDHETSIPPVSASTTPSKPTSPSKDEDKALDDIVLMELVVRPETSLVNRSARDLRLRTRYNINLLAVSRQGARSFSRLRNLPLQPGDLLLMQGSADILNQFASDNGCVPLANRDLRIPDTKRAWLAAIIMIISVGGAAFGLLPASIFFAIGVLASMATMTISPRSVYQAIDWPVVVLLGALIPVANAVENTGTAALIAEFFINAIAQGNAVLALTLLLITAMFLSDVMNNAATAAVMCPIAIGTANSLEANPDAFLMAISIGASCAFLTPIGHQNNTLILGPAGLKFSDYWPLGLPIELLVISFAIPLLLILWPL